ncbi:biotin synthase auxiliary protein BsaP [Actinoalloteichus hymeniacidonis]|uniref:biotin synthase auxiliary protein BsaP n=1 Tax=Actinoalloteichus hymeniacidonis TaxID=340345 RepID=UPI0009FF1F08|nr:hypothetical protein [Actinoalloteichus hymeniacidonis]
MPDAEFCGWCAASGSTEHAAGCARRRIVDPPRYCVRCARRMVVQVTPAGWSARCSAHGELHAPELGSDRR